MGPIRKGKRDSGTSGTLLFFVNVGYHRPLIVALQCAPLMPHLLALPINPLPAFASRLPAPMHMSVPVLASVAAQKLARIHERHDRHPTTCHSHVSLWKTRKLT